MTKKYFKALSSLGLFAVATAGLSQEMQVAERRIPKLENPNIVIDAKEEEAAWKSAFTSALAFEVSPGDLQKTDIKTQAAIFHDGEFLYVLIKAFDSNPEAIKANQTQRDAVSDSDDSIRVSIDPQGNDRRAFNLQVNAVGVQEDWISSNFGDDSYNWSGEWQSVANKNAEGYFVELKIPFATLQMQPDKAGIAKIKWNVRRNMGRGRNESLSVAAVDFKKTCVECQFVPATLNGVNAPTAQLRLNPFIVASQSYARSSINGELEATENNADIGLDGVWKFSPKDKLVFALNPDYSQIEADSIQFQVNQRFARGLSERRPFFNEDSGFYSGLLYLLNTRSMADPEYGLQYIRRDGNLSLGAIYVQDATTSFVLPGLDYSQSVFFADSSQDLILRSTYKANDKFQIGGMALFREGENGYGNRVLSADINWTISDKQSLQMQVANSSTNNSQVLQDQYLLPDQQQGNSIEIDHQYSGKYYSAYTFASALDENFRADLGGINQVGLWRFNHGSSWQYKPGKASAFEYLNTGVNVSNSAALSGAQLGSDTGIFFNIGLKNKTNIGAGLTKATEYYENIAFKGSYFYAYCGFKPTNNLNVSINIGQSDSIDYANLIPGKNESISLYGSYSFKSKLEMTASVGHSQFKAPLGLDYAYNSGYLSANYHLNLKHHLKLIGSYGGFTDFTLQPAPGVSNKSQAAQYQFSYQYKPSAFKYFIAGVSGSANNALDANKLETRRIYAFSKLVWDF